MNMGSSIQVRCYRSGCILNDPHQRFHILTIYRTLDVKGANILIVDINPSEDLFGMPVVERPIKIAGETFTALLTPLPLQSTWSWLDPPLSADNFTVMLNDLGTSELLSFVQENYR